MIFLCLSFHKYDYHHQHKSNRPGLPYWEVQIINAQVTTIKKKVSHVSLHCYQRAVTELQIQILAWLVFLHYINWYTSLYLQRQNHPDRKWQPRVKQPGKGTLWSTSCQAWKLIIRKKQACAFATGTV